MTLVGFININNIGEFKSLKLKQNLFNYIYIQQITKQKFQNEIQKWKYNTTLVGEQYKSILHT
jgi:hypothetical protein